MKRKIKILILASFAPMMMIMSPKNVSAGETSLPITPIPVPHRFVKPVFAPILYYPVCRTADFEEPFCPYNSRWDFTEQRCEGGDADKYTYCGTRKCYHRDHDDDEEDEDNDHEEIVYHNEVKIENKVINVENNHKEKKFEKEKQHGKSRHGHEEKRKEEEHEGTEHKEYRDHKDFDLPKNAKHETRFKKHEKSPKNGAISHEKKETHIEKGSDWRDHSKEKGDDNEKRKDEKMSGHGQKHGSEKGEHESMHENKKSDHESQKKDDSKHENSDKNDQQEA